VVTPLWSDGSAGEFFLIAGKVENLRRAVRAFDGTEIPAGEVLSFWRQVGPPWRIRGYVEGREINQGCVIPAVAGGLCQLSNALARAAEVAGTQIVERHGHTAQLTAAIPGSGDATVFWNYVDLRIRAPFQFRVEASLDAENLVVRIRASSAQGRKPVSAASDPGLPMLRGCLTCDETACFRHGRNRHVVQAGRTTALLNAWSPEFSRFLAREFPDARRLTPWVRPARLRGDGWKPEHVSPSTTLAGFVKTMLLRSHSQGGTRQQAIMRADEWLARAYSSQLAQIDTELVVDQSLLVALARSGVLGGRRYTVLASALPVSEIERRLDEASRSHPRAATLRDFRIGAEHAACEWAALRGAARIVTPHALAAQVMRDAGLTQVELLQWEMPEPRVSRRGLDEPPAIGFPASALPRKGALDLAQAARELGWKVVLGGRQFPADVSWEGILIEHRPMSQANWLEHVDIVALPAHVEHSPRMLLAALAAGIPVIASEACGLHPGLAWFDVPAGDSKALVDALREAMATPVKAAL
jgi:hypothetical protein